jgi:LPXTG-site transpeptidase (sortase) family protein
MVDDNQMPHFDPDDEDRPFQMDYEDVPPKSLPGSRQASDYEPISNPAAELIRRKLDALYSEEPNYKEEIKEVEAEQPTTTPQMPHFDSKHQAFMYNLNNSGRSLAEIQTAWHNYYLGLPDHEKQEVWEEFYKNNAKQNQSTQNFHQVSAKVNAARENPIPEHHPKPKHRAKHVPKRDTKVVVAQHTLSPPKQSNKQRVNQVRREVIKKVTADGRLKAKHHLQSLAFGLSLGIVVIVVFLFSFFNEIIIAPFVQPSRTVSATPLILSGTTAAATQSPEVIIPKINVEIPVDYSQTSTDENVIENALESGVVHYPSTVMPGQVGNAAFFGHSSNNIFNPGKYKFAFVLLHTLVPGDTFYLVYNGTNYAYQVFQTKIVPPSDVSVLNAVPGQTATATLITCDPPGTSINRLVVWGKQISPSPSGNTNASPTTATATAVPTELPGNGPSLWDRLVHFVF